MAGYNPVKEKVRLEKSSFIGRTYTLEHTEAYLDSVKQVKALSAKRWQWIRRIVFATGAAGSTGTAIYYNLRAGQYADDQQDIQDDYREAASGFDSFESRYESKAEIAKQARTRRNLLTTLAGVFACGFVISIPF